MGEGGVSERERERDTGNGLVGALLCEYSKELHVVLVISTAARTHVYLSLLTQSENIIISLLSLLCDRKQFDKTRVNLITVETEKIKSTSLFVFVSRYDRIVLSTISLR